MSTSKQPQEESAPKHERIFYYPRLGASVKAANRKEADQLINKTAKDIGND